MDTGKVTFPVPVLIARVADDIEKAAEFCFLIAMENR